MKLTGDRLYLRFLEEADAELLLGFHLRNREFFQMYTALRGDDFYTLDYQLNRIRNGAIARDNDTQYTFGMFLSGNDELIGIVDLSEVIRGSLQACWVGYSLDQSQNGRGYMTEAVRLVADYAFAKLKLHRLEAGVMPRNPGSIKVLEKAGFHQEGLNEKNVKINGRWEDHLHFALVNPQD